MSQRPQSPSNDHSGLWFWMLLMGLLIPAIFGIAVYLSPGV
jgi:hypothetical protein